MYRNLEESDSDDEKRPNNAFGADIEPPSITRRARCFDFWFCRRNSATLLVVLDVLFLAATIWTYTDMVITLIERNVLGHGGDAWVYVLLGVPALLQIYTILLRIRYATSSDAAHADIDWQLRYVSRPFMLTMINGLAFDIYLIMLPLYATATVPPSNDGLASFSTLWLTTFRQPSNIVFNVLFLLTMVCNWRVASKHRWRVKTYIAVLQTKANSWDREQEFRPAGPPQRPPPTRPPPHYNTVPRPVHSKLPVAEMRVMQTKTEFVPEGPYFDDNGKPVAKEQGTPSRKRRSNRGKKNGSTRPLTHKTTASPQQSMPSLDDSMRSGEDVVGERW